MPDSWTFKDKGYVLYRCDISIDGDDLAVKMSGYRRKPVTFRIEGFRGKTALEAMAPHGIQSDAYMGRHFEDAVFQVYHDLGLDFGYVIDPTRALGGERCMR